jgi:hypothetical protein
MFCRRCNLDRPTYTDFMSNRLSTFCSHCNYRILEGPMIPNEQRAMLLTVAETVRLDEYGKPAGGGGPYE